MLIELDDYDLNELKRVEKKIGKCKVVQIGDHNYMDVEELKGIIENLDYEIERIQEKYDDLRQDLEDNYRQIPQAEQYSISDRDFI